ncbi:hypothetical protein CsSME_00001895 [Camellia sinensis var. sinensis]
MGYVDGRIQALSITKPSYDQWEITNSLIMGWLIHSMVLKIGEGYLSMKTAQDIWDAVATNYFRKGNFSQTFELRCSIERVFKFLEGLNVELDLVRRRVLGMDNEESRSAIMPPTSTDRSALLSVFPWDGPSLPLTFPNPSTKGNLVCDYCCQPRHTSL